MPKRSWKLGQDREAIKKLLVGAGKRWFTSSAATTYEDMSTKVVRRALARREKWISRAFGDVTQTLSKMAVPDMSSLLKMVETDLSLVHAAYYTDDERIERIADWISGKETSTKDVMPSRMGVTEYAAGASPSLK